MELKVIYLQVAVQDLRSIYDYIAQDSKKYAQIEIKRIRAFINSLKEYPLKGRRYDIRKDQEVRLINFRNYMIFYSVTEKHINVLSVHHHSRLIGNNPIFKVDD
jgi:plasmid stabilization system protein ParE